MPPGLDYVYRWKNNSKRAQLYGRRCRVLCRGSKNSALVEFLDNGQTEVVSRNALRRFDEVAKRKGIRHDDRD